MALSKTYKKYGYTSNSKCKLSRTIPHQSFLLLPVLLINDHHECMLLIESNSQLAEIAQKQENLLYSLPYT